MKGLYKKALAGEIKNFTGVDDPYEAPLNAEVVIRSAQETVDDSVAKIIRKLEEMDLIPPVTTDVYSKEEEEVVEERLRSLGYM